ncbi:MAG: hypothetical protein HRJ53_12530 [Acidobacteria bacterium Pan2503]|uniref:Uncharacterized protein n=1 Tax=Candidatus Acidiferrum panamense TaxID=2741543 RepID=A0A7V8SXE3_9BACT|nr:hypothetical protein [Candidatus Acidoferrum panamensis]
MTTLGPITTVGTYEFQVGDLLHDTTFNRWSQSQIDTYINTARKQLVMDTGCLRSLQNLYLTAGVEQYLFGQVTGAVITNGGTGYSGPSVVFTGGGGSSQAVATLTQSGGAVNTITFTSFGSGYTSTPTATISDTGAGTGASLAVGFINVLTFDVLDIHPLWGTQRYSLDWYPFRTFSALFRQWTAAAYQRQPVAWAVYGDNSVFIGPPPDQSYNIEFDTIIMPTPFAVADTTTVDAIPNMAQDPIQFYAAYLAKKNAQNYGEAEQHLNDYHRRLMEVTAVYTGRIKSQYGTGVSVP